MAVAMTQAEHQFEGTAAANNQDSIVVTDPPLSPFKTSVSAQQLQMALAAAERHTKELEAKAATDSASSSSLEERLKALAQQKQKLTEDMKDKLPEGYHPLNFELQGERGLMADKSNSEKKGPESQKPIDSNSVDKLNATQVATDRLQLAAPPRASLRTGPNAQKAKFLPEARRNRMKGVDETIASAPSSLRAQAVVPKENNFKSRGGARLTADKPKSVCVPAATAPNSRVAAVRASTSPTPVLAVRRSPSVPVAPKSTTTATSNLSPRPRSAAPPPAERGVAKVVLAERIVPKSAAACAKPSTAPRNTRKVESSRVSDKAETLPAAPSSQSGGPKAAKASSSNTAATLPTDRSGAVKAAKAAAVPKQTRSLRQLAGSSQKVAQSPQESQATPVKLTELTLTDSGMTPNVLADTPKASEADNMSPLDHSQSGSPIVKATSPTSPTTPLSSMSGVIVADECLEAYNAIKMGKKTRYFTFMIKDKKSIVVDQTGPTTETFDDFLKALPADQPRYGLVDVEYQSTDGRPQSKLCFVFWCPDDTCLVRDRMIYASSKDAIVKIMPGVMKAFQANAPGDLQWATVLAEMQK